MTLRAGLSAYAIRIREKNSAPDAWLPLGDFTGEGDDLATFVGTFLNELKVPQVGADNMLRVDHLQKAGAIFTGMIATGDFGYENDLVDTSTMQVAYRRKQTDAEMRPFFFLVHAPDNADEGIALLQRSGQLGIRGAFAKPMIEEFGDAYPGHRLEFNPLESGESLRDLLGRSELKAIRFVRFEVPTDIADAYSEGWHHEEEATAEFILRARPKHALPVVDRILQFADGQRLLTELIELPDFDYNDVKLEVSVGGRRRTIDLRQPLGHSTFDVTEDVSVGSDGHPSYSSVRAVAMGILDDLRAAMGVRA